MKQLIFKFYNFIGSKYLNPLLKHEQKNRPFVEINERATEYNFALKHMKELCDGKVLDIGSGKSSWPHLLTTCGFEIKAIDKMDEYWTSYFNRHFKVDNDDITKSKRRDKFQFVTCLSVLEHISDHKSAMQNIHELLDRDGYLILTFPYNENAYHANIYRHPNAGYGQNANFVTQVYSRREIDKWLSLTSFEIVHQEYYKVFSGEMWTMGKRIHPCKETTATELHHLTCVLLKKRG